MQFLFAVFKMTYSSSFVGGSLVELATWMLVTLAAEEPLATEMPGSSSRTTWTNDFAHDFYSPFCSYSLVFLVDLRLLTVCSGVLRICEFFQVNWDRLLVRERVVLHSWPIFLVRLSVLLMRSFDILFFEHPEEIGFIFPPVFCAAMGFDSQNRGSKAFLLCFINWSLWQPNTYVSRT